MDRKDNPSRGFCTFQPLFASSIIWLFSVKAAKAENPGAADRFSPSSPWQKCHSSMEACFHQVVAQVVAVLAGASDLKLQLSFRCLHCTMNWAADDLLCTCDVCASKNSGSILSGQRLVRRTHPLPSTAKNGNRGSTCTSNTQHQGGSSN